MARLPVAGLSQFTMNGETWSVTKSSWRASNPKRDMLTSQTSIDGYGEKPMTGHITVTIRAAPGQDVASLANTTDGTGVLEQRNGTTVYGSQLVQTGEAETDTAEGTTDMVFEGVVTTSVAQ